MFNKTLKDVQAMVAGSGLAPEFYDVMACGVVIDSRAAHPGNLYIPIIGARANGHDFSALAVSTNGASATLWQRDVPNMPTDIPVIIVEDTKKALQDLAIAYKNELNMKIVGITGSNGKTSTKDILASILAMKFKVHKTPGNLNSEFGMPLTLLMAPTDTEIAVLEMGMRGLGQIKLLSEMAKPDVAMITCIGEAHIEELGTRENISIAKYEITAGLSRDGLFVYHGDEPLLDARISEDSPVFRMESFGDEHGNDYYPTKIEVAGNGMVFEINGCDLEFRLSVLGKHNVMNAIAAIAVARHFGVEFGDIQTGLTQIEMSKMRMETSVAKNGMMIIDDSYNSSPTSVRATLDLLYSLEGYQQKIVVLADMLELGEHEITYHQTTGAEIDPDKIDVLLTFGPLSEHIWESSKVTHSRHFDTKPALAEYLESITGAKDVCLIKGSRGMGLEEIIELLK